MAERGVKLDWSRKLKTTFGVKVTSVIINYNRHYPFIAFNEGVEIETYTPDGFVYLYDEDYNDLIYDDEPETKQEENSMSVDRQELINKLEKYLDKTIEESALLDSIGEFLALMSGKTDQPKENFMQLEVFDKAGSEENKPILLKLLKSGGDVIVRVVDKEGFDVPSGNLIKFNSKGKIEFIQGINESLGFSLDEDGELNVGSRENCNLEG